ncbi:MAG: CvpA family protein [Saprospiraceae bacterium]
MPIDIVCMAAFLYGFWKGYSQGIISTVFSVLAYIFGIVFAFKMTPTATNILETLFNSNNPMMFVAAFVVNVVFIMFVIRQAAKGFEGMLTSLHLGIINQAIGGAIMGLFGVLIFSVLVWFGDKAGMINEATRNESQTYATLIELPGKTKVVADRIKPFVIDAWETSMKWMNRVEDFGEKQTGADGENTEKPRIYEIPDKDAPGIEGMPEENRPNQRPIYEDTGSGIEDE